MLAKHLSNIDLEIKNINYYIVKKIKMMEKEKKTKIAQILKDKGVHLPCPRCETIQFEIVGQTSLPLHENLSIIRAKTSSVPSAMIACSNCGFITFHALGTLDLLPKP